MTDRYTGFIVALKESLSEEEAQKTITAITQIKGVIGIDPVEDNVGMALAKMQVGIDIKNKLIALIHEI